MNNNVGLNFSKYKVRFWLIAMVLTLAIGALLWRVTALQLYQKEFLRNQGDARTLRIVKMPTYRGMILDRKGEPLAVSSPVDSLWVNPTTLDVKSDEWQQALEYLGITAEEVEQKISKNQSKEFLYIKRHLPPAMAKVVLDLKIPGVYLQREYRRYYPEGEITSHILGFTDIDDVGQEGLELAFNQWLTGIDGKKLVLKDRIGREVETLDLIQTSIPGKNVQLSIDKHIQYLAYRELKSAVAEHNATAGSVVVLDIDTGEILAMVNQPSFNPNSRFKLHDGSLRNRAVTDVFEPGSVIKAFSVANILESGMYDTTTMIDTSPGWYKVDSRNIVKDGRNLGEIDLAGVLRRSSNVGISKLTLNLPSNSLNQLLDNFGFGRSTGSGFPGESSGVVVHPTPGQNFVLATLAFGYGMAVTPLQLAQAYATLGSYGVRRPATFLKQDKAVLGEKVLSSRTAAEVISMLSQVVEDGSGFRAKVKGYRVAGKTGTVRKLGRGGYSESDHISVFAGVAPVVNPKIAMVVMIDEPQGEYYGSQVAAPVFSRIMEGALRVLNVAPDSVSPSLRLAHN